MSLHVQRLAASNDSATAPELVLIHGWGMSSAIWAIWLPHLRAQCNITLLDLPGYGASAVIEDESVDALLAAILRVLPARAVYVGYSLGGMLATLLSARFPDRVSALITLSSNAKYVADEQWPWAMPAATFAAFGASLEHPAAALKRFAGLQVHGCHDEKALLKEIRNLQQQIPAAVLKMSLQWLSDIDLRAELKELSVPSLFCFAQNDALVPAIVVKKFPAETTVLPDAAHAMFISHPQLCAETVLAFLIKHRLIQPSEIDSSKRRKLDVARSFSRAAATYDSVAELQRQVGESLLAKIPARISIAGQSVVDLGCGTGYFHQALSQKLARVSLVGIDFAEGMVRHCARHRRGGLWLCGDAENMPLAERSVALVFSSLAIQWCEDIDAVFAEMYRVLRPGGWLVFSTLGPDTLRELRDAWLQVDDYTHVNGFQSWQRLSSAITSAGFPTLIEPEEESVTLEYNTLHELTAELKSLGAHNVNSGRPAGLTGKQRLLQFFNAYEQQRNERGYLPASYQVWYGVLRKPRE